MTRLSSTSSGSPLSARPRVPSSSPAASHSSAIGSSGGTSQDAIPTPISSPISGRETTRDETPSPQGRSPSPGVDVSRLSTREDSEEPQSPRGRSPSLSVDLSGLSLGDDPDEPTPYDIDSEQMPPHRFYSEEFQGTLREGVRIAKRAVRAIDQLTSVVGHDETLVRLREDAQRLSSFRPADMKTIAVLGDSGEGKSSLINSLLGFPRLAKTGDIGSACTSVVTEYHQKKEDHSAPITIEVDCMPQPEIEEVLSELLWSYRQLYLPFVESSDTSEADYARYARESAQAWSALEAAFGHRRGFREEQLQDMSEGAMERLKTRLIEWSRELEWPAGVEDGRWASTAGAADECCAKTQVFMNDQYWPFTKVIRIYLDAQVLKTGVVLADLPGLQDTNLARVRATQDYLMRCDNIFIVAKISRAVTDQSLRSSLFSVFSRHVPLEWEESAARSLSIAVVCTKSDDINLEAARREFCGPGNRIPASEMADLDREIESAKAGRNRPLKKELKLRRELTFIDARNQHVTEALQAAYASRAPDRNLEVFCVSNKLYEKYSRKGNAGVVRASAVPAVRRFCHAVSADAQLRAARHYLRSSLFGLVNSLHIWSGSAVRDREQVTSSEKMNRVLRRTLDDADAAFSEAASRLRSDFDECFQEQIQVLLPNRQPDWEGAAASEAKEWRVWHYSQYKAWCANNGSYYTRKRGAQDWNAKIIWKMRSELAFQWDIVEEEIPELFRRFAAEVDGTLTDLKESILGICDDGSRGMITDAVEAGLRQLAYQRNISEQRFTSEFRVIRRYSSESSHNSYVLGEMLPAYRTANIESGTGMFGRQQAIIEGRINDGALFPNILIAITEKMGILVRGIQDELRDATRRVIARIMGDVDLVLVAARPQREEARSSESLRRLGELAGIVEALKGDICRVGDSLETGGS